MVQVGEVEFCGSLKGKKGRSWCMRLGFAEVFEHEHGVSL